MKNSIQPRFTKSLTLAALACAWAAAPFYTQANDWTGGVGYWNDAANWNGGVPDNAGGWAIGNIGNNGTAFVTNTVPHVSEAWAGNGGVAGTIVVTNDGTLPVDNWLVVGRTGGGGNTPLSTLIVAGTGVINKTGDGFIVGDGTFCKGQVIVKDNAVVNVNGGWNGIGNGNGGEGWLTLQDNAVYTLTAGRDWNIGDYGSGRGHAYIKDNATLNVVNFWIGKADTSFGRVFQTGGAIVGGPGGNEWCIGGQDAAHVDAFGYYDLAAGTFSTPNNFQIGRNGKGVIYQSGGSITASSWTSFGRFTGSIGVMWMTGGTFSHTGTGTQLFVAENGRGEFTLAGTGVLDCNLKLRMGNSGGTGFMNFNGGTAVLPGIEQSGGTGAVSFNGGTIKAKASTANFMSGLADARIYSGNAIFDTDGKDITIAQPLLGATGNGVLSIPVTDGGAGYLAPPIVQITGDGYNATAVAQMDLVAGKVTSILVTCPGYYYFSVPTVTLIGGAPSTAATLGTPVIGAVTSGGIVKNGAGTLTLSGANDYTGTTVVNQGKLINTTDAYGAAPVTVANGAGYGAKLSMSFGQLYISSLALGTSAGTTLDFDVGGFGNPVIPPLNVWGNVALNGTVTVNIADTLPQIGLIPLLQYGSRSGTGNFVLGTLPAGVQGTLVHDTTAKTLSLNITGVGLPRWEGLAGGDWDVNTTTNWIERSTGLPTYFKNGAPVLFNDEALGLTTVNLTAAVTPASVTFTNDTLAYTLTGSGKISGTTSVTKQGTNTVTIANTGGNDYTGATVISGGKLIVTALANAGVPSAIGSSTEAANNLVLTGGTLSYTGPTVQIDRGHSVQGAGSTIETINDLTLGGTVTATVGSSSRKTGAGRLTYSNPGVNELSGGAWPGYNVMDGTLVFDGSGTQVNHSQNEFWVGSTPDAPAHLVLNNAVLNVDSWFALGRGNGTIGNLSTATLYNSILRSGNSSLGYWNNIAGHLAQQMMTLNGDSTFTNNGDCNIGESAGSSAALFLNGTSKMYSGWRMLVGYGSSTSTGAVTIADSASLTVNAWMSLTDQGGVGSLTMKNNGSLWVLWDLNVTDRDLGDGTLNIQDNATVTANNFFVGKGVGSSGIVNQTGGSAVGRLNDGNEFQIGFHGPGIWNLSGGSIVAPNHWFIVGRYGDGPGELNVTGGTIIHGTNNTGKLFRVGEEGTGTLNLSNTGDIQSFGDAITVGPFTGANGIINLNGGSLLARRIIGGVAGASAFNFNGGLLRVGPNPNVDFMSGLGSANVMVGGAKIDTGTNNVAIAQALLDGGGNGGLTKQGTGTLSLDGVNTYLGTTTISAGGLAGSGTIAGPVVFAANTTLSPGASIGTLTVNGTLSLAGTSTTLMEVSKNAGISDLVTGVSTITYGGTLVLKNLGGVLVVGETFNLFDATTYLGSFTGGVVSQTPGQTVTWDTTKLTTDGTVKVLTAVANPVTLTSTVSGGSLNLSWPASQLGYRLEVQTNPITVGLSNNWVTVPGSADVTSVSVPVSASTPTAFYRLVFP